MRIGPGFKEPKAWAISFFVVLAVLFAACTYVGVSNAAACGVNLSAPANLQDRLNAASGKTVCLHGTFRGIGIRPAKGQTIIGGHLIGSYDLHNGGITLRSVEVSGGVVGVKCGPHATIRDSYIHDNSQNGIACIASSEDWHIVIIGNRITSNSSQKHAFVAAGGIKLLQLSKPGHCLGCGATVSGNNVSNNIGNGIWFDRSSNGIIANNNVTSGNTHYGMRCEKCGGPVQWTGNLSYGNHFHQYSLRNSAFVTMTNNVSRAGGSGALVVAYGDKDDKNYPTLGNVTLGYHPWRITVNDAGKLKGKMVGCTTRNVTCR